MLAQGRARRRSRRAPPWVSGQPRTSVALKGRDKCATNAPQTRETERRNDPNADVMRDVAAPFCPSKFANLRHPFTSGSQLFVITSRYRSCRAPSGRWILRGLVTQGGASEAPPRRVALGYQTHPKSVALKGQIGLAAPSQSRNSPHRIALIAFDQCYCGIKRFVAAECRPESSANTQTTGGAEFVRSGASLAIRSSNSNIGCGRGPGGPRVSCGSGVVALHQPWHHDARRRWRLAAHHIVRILWPN
jgi:hypothetical protein